MKIYGYNGSGNCLKVRFVADYLGLDHDWIETDIMKGESRTEAFLALNPLGQVPVIEFADGRTLNQSNAIMLHLGEGSSLLPADAYERAKVFEWLFYEQHNHEPYIADVRFAKHYLGKSQAELDPEKIERGYQALAVMERQLCGADYFVGAGLSLADIALVAYTRMAHEGGFELSRFPRVRSWISRIEGDLGLEPYPA